MQGKKQYQRKLSYTIGPDRLVPQNRPVREVSISATQRSLLRVIRAGSFFGHARRSCPDYADLSIVGAMPRSGLCGVEMEDPVHEGKRGDRNYA